MERSKSRGRFSFLSLVLLILLCFTTCKASTNQNCHPSSCGHIRNISYPFWLKTDPNNCGLPSYELACENNQTILYLKSKRYYVQSISYENYTIQLVDPAIRKNQYCLSFPLHSLTADDIPIAYKYPREGEYSRNFGLRRLNSPVMFISCPSRVESSLYVETALFCNTKNASSNTSSSSLQEYSYVLLGRRATIADVENSCKISMVVWVTGTKTIDQFLGSPFFYWDDSFWRTGNISFSSILDRMATGFSLPWYTVYCKKCEARSGACYVDDMDNGVKCNYGCDLTRPHTLSLSYKCLREFLSGLLGYYYWNGHPSFVGKLTALILSARYLCGLPCLLILVVYKYRRQHLSNDDTIEDFLQAQNNLMPIRYKYIDIRKMTKNFKDKLGEGGYGSVFKGKLRSGPFVAVKMMNKSKASGQEFINEVATIGRIHHVNVVRLIGFCVEGSNRALIYEFMPNGSLEKYIFSPEERSTVSLSYEKMFEISLGVARGIDYLHRGCDMQILHFDIRPHNILLNQNFTPKISDFGLAKLYSADDSIVSLTAARGTIGYMALELFYKNIGGVSYKADVYSYGMLLMEMAGRRKNLNLFVENLSQIYFPSWVYDQFNVGKEIGMGDTSGVERKMVKKMILVALWCIQMKPADRPSMNKIVEMLEGDGEHLQMPPKPFLYPEESPVEDHDIHANDNELPLLSGDQIDSTSLDQDES